LLLIFCLRAQAQDKAAPPKKPAPIAPAEPFKGKWDEIDQRPVFLMVRLANVEASLEAVEKAGKAGSRKAAIQDSEARRAVKGNELMDRRGGAPATAA